MVLRSPFAFVQTTRVTASAFLEADEGPTERVGNRRSWMIAAFVCTSRRRCRKIRTFQLDMGWYYPAGEERRARRLRPFFHRRKALENGYDNSRADNETLRHC